MRLNILFFLSFFAAISLHAQKMSVSIAQDSVDVPIKDGVVVLSKKQFDINFVFDKKTRIIFLNASYEPYYYNSSNTDPVPDLENFFGYNVAEYPFNMDRDLIIDKETVHSLGHIYEHRGNKMHDFSTLKKKGSKYYGLREVDDWNDRTNKYPVTESQRPVYLYVIGLKKNPKKIDPATVSISDFYRQEDVIFRWKVKIEWKE